MAPNTPSTNFMDKIASRYSVCQSFSVANSILFTSDIRSGLLIEDYEIREEKGKNKLYHYQNSVDTLNIAWKNGCPN